MMSSVHAILPSTLLFSSVCALCQMFLASSRPTANLRETTISVSFEEWTIYLQGSEGRWFILKAEQTRLNDSKTCATVSLVPRR